MAVTQQIVRLSESNMLRCRSEVEALAALLCFDLVPRTDYLDLGWSPQGLNILVEISKQLPEVQLALFMALRGSTLVNTEHRVGPERDWVYSDVTMLFPDEVRQVSDRFELFDRQAFVECLPKSRQEACGILKLRDGFRGHPRRYYSKCMDDLIDFYKAAAEKKMATAMWWD